MIQDFKYEQVGGVDDGGSDASSQHHLIFKLSGDLMGGAPAMDFQTFLNNLSSQSSKIIFDLTQVNIVNSSGLGMLVAAHTHLKNVNKTLVLCSVGDNLSSLVKMTHLDKVFKIADNIESAIKL